MSQGPYNSKVLAGFFRYIGQLGHGGLHAVCHFVLRDSSGDLGIAVNILFGFVIQASDSIQDGAARFRIDTIGVCKKQDGVAGCAETHALILRRQEIRWTISG